MRRSKRHYDEWVRQLASGDVVAHGEHPVATFIGLLRDESGADAEVASAFAVTLAAQARDVAENTLTLSMKGRVSRPLVPRWRRRVMISTFLSTLFGKLAIGTVAVAVAATGLAATGNLPDVAQQRVDDLLSGIGIGIPDPTDQVPDAAPDIGEPEGLEDREAPGLPDEAADPAESVLDAVFGSDPKDGALFGADVACTASDGASGAASEALEKASEGDASAGSVLGVPASDAPLGAEEAADLAVDAVEKASGATGESRP